MTDDPAGFWLRASDGTLLALVYENRDHLPGSFTTLNLPVVDIDAAVDQLTARGVRFLRYAKVEQDRKGIHRGRERAAGPDIARLADPAGNVLSVLCEGTD